MDILVYILAIAMRILALVILLVLLIPLQIREVKVKDGLSKLRYQLLIMGVVLFSTNFITLIISIRHVFMTINSDVLQSLSLLNGLMFLILSVNLYMIYRHKYK